MNQQLIAIQNNETLVLPRSIRQSWADARVYISVANDTLLVKRVSQPAMVFAADVRGF